MEDLPEKFSSTAEYIDTLVSYLEHWDGDTLGHILSLSYTDKALDGISKVEVSQALEASCATKCSSAPGFAAVFTCVVQRSAMSKDRDWQAAFEHQKRAFDAFSKVFKSQTNWCLGTMISLARDMRIIARKADKANELDAGDDDDDGSHRQTALDQAGSKMISLFAACNNDPTECFPYENGSRKWGTLPLVNQMLKCFFIIDKVHLVAPVMNPLEMTGDAAYAISMGDWNMSDQVTYNFFTAREFLNKEDYSKAEERLNFCLANCHQAAEANIQRILIFLVPLRLMLGKAVPSSELLLRHSLEAFSAARPSFTGTPARAWTRWSSPRPSPT